MDFIPPPPPRKPSRFIGLVVWLFCVTFWLVLVVFACAMTLGTLCGWLADRVWLCEIACHFQVQYVVGLTALTIVFALGHRRGLALGTLIVAVLAFSIQWLPIYWPEVPRSEGPRSLRLLSANLQFDNPSHELFFDLIDREKPDVILLFELSWKWLPDLKFLEREYPYFRVAPSPGHSGCGIYSRLPLEEVSIDGVPPGPNFVVKAQIAIADTVVNVFGTHPLAPYTPEERDLRNQQLSSLAKLVGFRPSHTIVAGDFNTSSWSPCFGRFVDTTGLRDTRRGFGICPTFPARFWPAMTPIDHCLVSLDIGVVDRRVGKDIGSDHLPIVVDLQIAPSR